MHAEGTMACTASPTGVTLYSVGHNSFPDMEQTGTFCNGEPRPVEMEKMLYMEPELVGFPWDESFLTSSNIQRLKLTEAFTFKSWSIVCHENILQAMSGKTGFQVPDCHFCHNTLHK